MEQAIKKLESKKKNTQADLENVNAGKKTIRTLLKSDKDTTGMLNTIENVSVYILMQFSLREKQTTYNYYLRS